MSRTLSVFTSSLLAAVVTFAPSGRADTVKQPAYAFLRIIPDPLHRSLYPDNVECKYFDKTGYKTWQLRDRSTVDLGNWGAAFPITGAITPGTFVSKGLDLFDVLEKKCGRSASLQGAVATVTW